MGGISLELEQQMAFVEQDLSPYLAEFLPDHEPEGGGQKFFLHNATYESVDAETLYAMVRFLHPRRVIELGSGRSTQIISAALAKNRAAGMASTCRVVDPYPKRFVTEDAGEQFQLDLMSAADVGVAEFAELEANDILFVDTTHTVKFAGDVNHIVLEVLPALNKGVVVHFHDIFLPWPYPRKWLLESKRFWTEQYLIQAFLAFNSSFKPLLSAYALTQRYPSRLQGLIPSYDGSAAPGAFWLQRTNS
jgi:hypothetical protein